MSVDLQASLFEPSSTSPVASSIEWINGVLFGQIAIGLCVLAVAFVGALMLSGRLPLRGGIRVVLGCFVLLGAPVIAAGFMGAFKDRSWAVAAVPTAPTQSPRGDIEPAEYDPYAGASLRQE
ncbi:TrbC/VirB2 family protein [uncultured Erythrobacter sp.]|uniref:TrbC/VirB2 family protein n=1 Tax=uncultured Erythrobacter sp. TaxID=263913 RepID=UPI00260F77C0|nr:TrbC/VirB2 family protein [uncultured Erythrobacter sp.]